jgi:uncharacterized protein YjdB
MKYFTHRRCWKPGLLMTLVILILAACIKEPVSVTVSPSSLSLTEGESAPLAAKVLPEDASYDGITWTSSNKNVATVSNGLVKAVAPGTATITATAENVSGTATVTVKAKVYPVTGVTLDKTSLTLTEGETETLKATVAPDNATDKSITWSSSNASVATVDASGKVTAVSAGTATITVKTADGGKTADCAVTVNQKVIPVTGVSLDKTELELTKGETATLTATVAPEDATDKSLTWNSLYPEIASVDDNGKITALEPGNTQITVRTNDGGKTATCKLTVKPVEVTGITVSPATLTVKEGHTGQLTATIAPAEADQTVEWASMDSKIATVDADGVVTGVKSGTTRIFARSKAFPDKQASCDVTVEVDDTLKGIALDATSLNLTIGESRTLTVIFDPSYAANKNVSWESTDEAVASVKDGKVVGLSDGLAVITATSEEGGFTANCTVLVSEIKGAVVYSLGAYEMGSGTRTGLYLNGAPDGRDHAFDTEDLKYKGCYLITASGSTLYSLEYYEYKKTRAHYWLCKDRKPMIDLTEYCNATHIDMEVRDETVCILQQNGTGANYSVVVVKSDGTVASYPITGSFKGFYTPDLALAPDGTVYVSARIKDAFNAGYIALYKLNPDGSWSETLLESDTSSNTCIDVTENGDVYVFVSAEGGTSKIGHMFKNGELYQTFGTSPYNLDLALRCIGNDVYAAAEDFVERTVTIYKNGEALFTISADYDIVLTSSRPTRPLWVTADGDVYFSIAPHTVGSYRLYKNGTMLYTSPFHNFSPICVTEPK